MHNFLSRCGNKTHNVFVQCTMYIAPIIQGDAKAPSQMKEGSVYDLIDKLDPTDLKYLSLDNIQVDVCDKAKEILNHAN